MKQESYKIKDLELGNGVFVKLNFALTLKDNQLLNIGFSFVLVNLVKESEDENVGVIPKLRLKLFGGPSNG